MKMTKAFTMIELIFVIVILGILAAVALPRFGGIRNQADITTGRAQVATIRAAIANERQSRLILGTNTYITPAALNNGAGLFGGVLTTSLVDRATAGNWNLIAGGTATSERYNYVLADDVVRFVYSDRNQTIAGIAYDAGEFNCDIAGVVANAAEVALCQQMVQ